MKTSNFIVRFLFTIVAVIALLYGKMDFMLFSMLYVIYLELEAIESKLPDKLS